MRSHIRGIIVKKAEHCEIEYRVLLLLSKQSIYYSIQLSPEKVVKRAKGFKRNFYQEAQNCLGEVNDQIPGNHRRERRKT